MIANKLIRVGIVSSVNPAMCAARVAFEDQGKSVSPELPILARGSLGTKDYWMPEPGEQVWCLYNPAGNADGIILGSVYSLADPPPVTDAAKRHLQFKDGSKIEYDSNTHTLLLDIKGPAKIIAKQAVDLHIKGKAKIVSDDEVKIVAPNKLIVDGSIDVSGTVNTQVPMTPEVPEEGS